LGVANVKLLADFWPHGKIAQNYGLFREEEGFSERANVLIGEDGKVVWVKVYPIPELPAIAEVLDEVKKRLIIRKDLACAKSFRTAEALDVRL